MTVAHAPEVTEAVEQPNTDVAAPIYELFKTVPKKPTSEYPWGYSTIPIGHGAGGRTIHESLDNNNHKALNYPWPHEQRPFHGHEKPFSEREAEKLGPMVIENLPEHGYSDKPTFSTNWEKLLAYHHGLYIPERHGAPKTTEEIKEAVNKYSATVNAEQPKDACKWLLIERFRCMQTYHADIVPNRAEYNCYKWSREWQQCQWDQEKFNRGLTYIEGRAPAGHKKYYFAPQYKFA